MTRTERSFNPRAIIKDRSESKSGLDKSDRKGGAGAHNWGSYADEQEHELRAAEDYEDEEGAAELAADANAEAGSAVSVEPRGPALDVRRASTVSEKERQQARQFRATALKDGSDLGAIARTSAAVSTSPPARTPSVAALSDVDASTPVAV